MKFILFNIIEDKKDKIRKLELDNKNYIFEFNLSQSKLEKRLGLNNTKNKFREFGNIFYDIKLKRKVTNMLGKTNGKWNYLFSNKINSNVQKYLSICLEEILGFKVKIDNELDKNIIKYINEYSKQNKKRMQEIKALIVAKENKNIDFNVIQRLIKEIKNIDIYLKDNISPYILNKINKINNEEGTTIDCIIKDKKDLKEYDLIYFVDSYKKEWPKFRMNKSSLILDSTTKQKDKYNSYLIRFKKYKQQISTNNTNIEYLCNQYNNLELANVICKVVFTY